MTGLRLKVCALGILGILLGIGCRGHQKRDTSACQATFERFREFKVNSKILADEAVKKLREWIAEAKRGESACVSAGMQDETAFLTAIREKFEELLRDSEVPLAALRKFEVDCTARGGRRVDKVDSATGESSVTCETAPLVSAAAAVSAAKPSSTLTSDESRGVNGIERQSPPETEKTQPTPPQEVGGAPAAVASLNDTFKKSRHGSTSQSSETATPSPAVEIPPYEIAEDVDLAPKRGRRIFVNVRDPDLTDTQCAAIVARLRSRAGQEGQVAVRVPLHNKAQNRFFPLCYDNLDGHGVQEGTARQVQRAFDNR